ncbi:MAG: AbgT family transporter [Thermoanaerobaculia bacterium]|nr:AbgT family transporter [Thermoanaerobaculia bacterium]
MKLRVPHPYVLLFGLVVVAALATWLLPAGTYERREAAGRVVVDPASYRELERRPAGASEVLLAFPRGLAATAPIVFYIFLIGGTFGVLQATGALDAGIHALVARAGGRGERVLPLLVFVFSLGGGTIGMAEETLPFLPGLVLLARRLGYDEVIAGGVALAGAGAGFSGAFLNPFTVGVAHGIAGLPLFSGMGYRLIVWATLTAATMLYVGWAARRHRVPAESAASVEADRRLTRRDVAVLLVLALALTLVVVGSFRWSWGLLELSGLFLAVAIVAGVAGGLGSERLATSFVDGAASLAGAALVVGLARGVLVILDGARATDAVLHGLANAVAGLPGWATVFGIYAVQVLLSYLVPSGSGQAALSLPILVPLGDLVGVTRQTSVLAYQFGDGFSNVFTPTQGYFMAGLALLGVSWTRWARFMAPLQLIWLGLGLVFLAVAHAIRWGPF